MSDFAIVVPTVFAGPDAVLMRSSRGISTEDQYETHRNGSGRATGAPMRGAGPCALPLIVDIAAAGQAGFDQRAST